MKPVVTCPFLFLVLKCHFFKFQFLQDCFIFVRSVENSVELNFMALPLKSDEPVKISLPQIINPTGN
jgi:hypothetical protein